MSLVLCLYLSDRHFQSNDTSQGLKMASSYDSTVFERSQAGFALSQRFKQLCSQFSGAIKLVLQIISTNALMRAVPRNVCHLLFVFYLIILIFLFLLIGKQQKGKETSREYDDPEFLVTTKYMLRNKHKKRSIAGFLITVLAFLFVANMTDWTQQTAIFIVNIYAIVSIYFIYCLFHDEYI